MSNLGSLYLAMPRLLKAILLFLPFSLFAQLQVDTVYFPAAVPVQDRNNLPNLNSISSCADTFRVQIPPGNIVSGIDLQYRLNTVSGTNGMPPAGIYSYLECLSTGLKEGQISQGSSLIFGASETLNRVNLNLANGKSLNGSVEFKLHAFDIAFFSPSCDTLGAKIEAGSWRIIIRHFPDTINCNGLVAPYFEDFDFQYWLSGQGGLNSYNQIQSCWSRPTNNPPHFGTRIGTTASSPTGPSGDFDGTGNYLYTEYSNSPGAPGEISSPFIFLPNSLTNPHLQFAYHMHGASIDSLIVEVSRAAQTQALYRLVGEQQVSSSEAWRIADVDLSNFSGDSIQITFKGFSSSFTGDIAIDNFAIVSINCPRPSQFYSNSQATNRIDLQWVSASNSHQIEYGLAGFNQGSGNLISASGNSAQVGGLNGGTTYEFYIRSFCGNDTSLWTGPIQASTSCSVYNAPFYENFDQGFLEGLGGTNAGASIGACWQRNSNQGFFWGGGRASTPSTGTGPPRDNTSGLGSYVYTEASGGANGDTAILISPLIDVSALNTVELRFWLHMRSQTSNPYLLWEIEQNGQWISLDTLSGDQGGGWQLQTTDLSSFTADSLRIRFISIKPSVGSPFQSDIAIDDLSIDEIPSCGVLSMPYAENFDNQNWLPGNGNRNNMDYIDPCWSRPITSLNRWGPRVGSTPSSNTGPAGDRSGTGKYIYTEATRGRAVASISTPSIYIDPNSSMPHLYYHYHMYGADIINLSIEVENSSGPILLRTHFGQQHNSSSAAWTLDSLDLSAYKGDTITINFLGDASSALGDIALDEIEVRDTNMNCAAPQALQLSSTLNSISLSWTNGNNVLLEYYDIQSGPLSAISLSGVNSPFTLSGLNPNTSYVIGIRNQCGMLQSAMLYDTATTLACAPVTSSYNYSANFLNVQFISTSSNADSLFWDFGDGYVDTGASFQHTYALAGTYTISLAAYNACGFADTSFQIVQVCDSILPLVQLGTSGDTLLYSAAFTGAVQWLWDFGDGSTALDSMGQHVYAGDGSYLVQLRMINACGDTANYSQMVQLCADPNADWTYQILNPINSGLRVQFDASLSRNAQSYFWDFDDGSTDTGIAPIHIFNPPGLYYEVSLRVRNACGAEDEYAYRLSEIGNEEYSLQNGFSVYPNPFKGYVQLDRKLLDNSPWQWRLYSNTGQLLMQGLVTNEKSLKIATSNLKKGIYYLWISNEQGSRLNWKLLK